MIHRDLQEHDGLPIAVLRIEHGKANAIDLDLFDALNETLDELEPSDARAVVLTGSGRNFSAGVDLFAVAEGGADYLRRFLPALGAGLRRVFTFSKPVVAAVNGHAIAGGCILALAADRRVCVDQGAKLGVTELLVGVPFPPAPMEVLRQHLPNHAVQDLVYTGRLLSPDEALRIGMVEELCPAEALEARAVAAAVRYGRLSPDAFGITKRQLRGRAIAAMDEGARTLDEEMARIWSDPATLDGIRAFMAATVHKKKVGKT